MSEVKVSVDKQTEWNIFNFIREKELMAVEQGK